MIKIDIKPLSVNQCWQGQRFKTPAYKKYETDCLYLLPKEMFGIPPYCLRLEFGMSNMSMDVDNPIKPFLDILQKKYGFNDKDVVELEVKKVKTEKGKEYIKWAIHLPTGTVY